MSIVSTRASRFAVTILAGLVAFTTAARAADVVESDQVSNTLSDAKMLAYQLSEDAASMEAFTRLDATWQSHVEAINKIKDNVNNMGRLLAKLQDARSGAAPWQQTAIDRITPVAKELAANTTAAIEQLNKNPNALKLPAYKEYLEAIYDSASNLAATIADFADYGRTSQRLNRLSADLDQLSTKLEVPPARPNGK